MTASGTPPLLFSWQKGGQPIPFPYATNSPLVLHDVKQADAGDYSVVVSNAYGSVTSLVATLTVNAPIGFEPVAYCYDGSFPGNAYDVAVRGNYAYVGGSEGLAIFDLSKPNDPRLVGRLQTTNGVLSVDVNPTTGLAGIGSGGGGLAFVDVSNPQSPLNSGAIRRPALQTTSSCVAVMLSLRTGMGGCWSWTSAILPYHSQFLCLRMQTTQAASQLLITPAFPTGVTLVPVGNGMRLLRNGGAFDRLIDQVGFNQECENARAVAVAQGYAYVADDWTGLLIADVHEPKTPSTVSRYLTSGSVMNVAVSDGKAYLSKMEDGLEIVDVSEAASPNPLGTVANGGSLWAVAAVSSHAFGADSEQGLLTFDVSNPTNPVVSGGFRTDQPARSVAVDGHYAYVVYGLSGLHIFDISKPYAPKWLSHYNTPGNAVYVQVNGGYAYVADRLSGLQIISIANPEAPYLAGALVTPGSAEEVQVVGRYAYVANGTNGLAVVDTSDPTAPRLLGGCVTRGPALGIHIEGSRAYLADGTNGLAIVDITDPANPVRLGEWYPSSAPDLYEIGAQAVDVVGQYAYLGVNADSGGLRILDVSNPAVPGFGRILRGSFREALREQCSGHWQICFPFLRAPWAGGDRHQRSNAPDISGTLF